MSSVERQIRQTGALFTNGKNMLSTILVSDGSAKATWVSSATAVTNGYYGLSTAGSAVFRDMGKLVYLPANPASGSQVSTVLRKVQLIPQAGLQTGQGVGNEASGSYYVGYVSVGGVDGVSGGLVRIN
jgi:hypothetical protein